METNLFYPISIAEYAKNNGITKQAVYAQIKAGKLNTIKRGNKTLISSLNDVGINTEFCKSAKTEIETLKDKIKELEITNARLKIEIEHQNTEKNLLKNQIEQMQSTIIFHESTISLLQDTVNKFAPKRNLLFSFFSRKK